MPRDEIQRNSPYDEDADASEKLFTLKQLILAMQIIISEFCATIHARPEFEQLEDIKLAIVSITHAMDEILNGEPG